MVDKYRSAENIDEQEMRMKIAHVATQEEMKAFMELSAKARDVLIKVARKIHVSTEHKPPSELATLLRKENASLAASKQSSYGAGRMLIPQREQQATTRSSSIAEYRN